MGADDDKASVKSRDSLDRVDGIDYEKTPGSRRSSLRGNGSPSIPLVPNLKTAIEDESMHFTEGGDISLSQFELEEKDESMSKGLTPPGIGVRRAWLADWPHSISCGGVGNEALWLQVV